MGGAAEQQPLQPAAFADAADHDEVGAGLDGERRDGFVRPSGHEPALDPCAEAFRNPDGGRNRAFGAGAVGVRVVRCSRCNQQRQVTADREMWLRSPPRAGPRATRRHRPTRAATTGARPAAPAARCRARG